MDAGAGGRGPGERVSAMQHGAGGLAYHEAAGLPDDAGAGVAVHGGEEVIDRGGAELFEIEVHGGQGRSTVGGEELPVVVSDDRHVVRDSPTEVAQGVGGASGDLVVAAEDRVHVRSGGEQ